MNKRAIQRKTVLPAILLMICLLIPAIQEAPWLLRTPVVRNGNRVTVGYQPETWDRWIRDE